MKEPGPAHPITITPHIGTVRVRAGGRVVAQSARALELREASYPPVLYIPREDVAADALAANPRRTQCPYKGEASYFDVAGGAAAAWSYENPFPAVARIRRHLAFYPDRVEAIET